jgi:hypothetical protein
MHGATIKRINVTERVSRPTSTVYYRGDISDIFYFDVVLQAMKGIRSHLVDWSLLGGTTLY